MNSHRYPVMMVLVAALSCVSRPARAYHEVDTSVEISAVAEFEAPLAAHGTWIEVDSYGRCWHPERVAVGWRPYCEGYWVWTDCEENKTIANIGPRKVVVNEGPRVDVIEKATSQKVRAAPIQEVLRHAPLPPAVREQAQKSPPRREQPPVTQRETPKSKKQRGPMLGQPAPAPAPREQPPPNLQREPPSPETPAPPPHKQPKLKPHQEPPPEPAEPPAVKPAPPRKGQQPSGDEVQPPAEQPPATNAPPAKSKNPKQDVPREGKKGQKNEKREGGNENESTNQ